MKIVFDCDDVLLDWKGAFIKWCNRNYDLKVIEGHPQDTWDMSLWFGIKPEEMKNLIVQFNSLPICLKPLLSREKLNQLKREKHELYVLSSFGSCIKCCDFRESYLKTLFGDIFEQVALLDLGACKEEALKNIKPDIFIEDNKEHAIKARDLGIETFLISMPYNQGVDGVTYVNNVKEAINQIV